MARLIAAHTVLESGVSRLVQGCAAAAAHRLKRCSSITLAVRRSLYTECFQGTARSSRLGVVLCIALSLRLWWCPHSCLVATAAYKQVVVLGPNSCWSVLQVLGWVHSHATI